MMSRFKAIDGNDSKVMMDMNNSVWVEYENGWIVG